MTVANSATRLLNINLKIQSLFSKLRVLCNCMSSYQQQTNIYNCLFSFKFQKMLCFSPNNRITASEALLHPYFSEYGFEPLSFSPSSNSTRSMRSSDASSSFNSSFLSSSSHDESGGSLGDPNQSRT